MFCNAALTAIQGAVDAFTGLVNNEINWILGQLPPLPPIPPFSAVAAASTSATPRSAAALTATSAAQQADVVTPAKGRFSAGRQLAKQVASDVVTAADDLAAAASNQVKAVAAIPPTVAKGIVAAQGGVRGAVSAAASDVAATAKSGDSKAGRCRSEQRWCLAEGRPRRQGREGRSRGSLTVDLLQPTHHVQRDAPAR